MYGIYRYKRMYIYTKTYTRIIALKHLVVQQIDGVEIYNQ